MPTSSSFGQRGRGARTNPLWARNSFGNAPTVPYGGAPHLIAKYSFAFGWIGLVGLYLAGTNFVELFLVPRRSGPGGFDPTTLDLALNWISIVVGVAVGCFSLWHALQGSPAHHR